LKNLRDPWGLVYLIIIVTINCRVKEWYYGEQWDSCLLCGG
jgi:hypothetical protein